jgi:hypothetical protein
MLDLAAFLLIREYVFFGGIGEMKRIFLPIALAVAMSAANAATCPNPNSWTFNCLSSSAFGSSGMSFTQNGETITIFGETINNSNVITGSTSLFEVLQNNSGNLASGIGPYQSSEGGSPFTGQKGIAEFTEGQAAGNILLLEISQPNIPSGSTLKFLMQEGDVQDTFNVWTGTFATGAIPTALTAAAGMTEVYSALGVDTNNSAIPNHAEYGAAVNPQFSITTSTTSAKSVEFIAIQADCTYLLLNQVIPNPEPRFFGLVFLGFACLAVARRYRKA